MIRQEKQIAPRRLSCVPVSSQDGTNETSDLNSGALTSCKPSYYVYTESDVRP